MNVSKITLKTGLIPLIAAFSFVWILSFKAKPRFEKAAFYKAVSSEDIQVVNAELEILKTTAIPEKEAYEGALLMRKAGLSGSPQEKLKIFKTGKESLEKAINKDENNVEYRFLRLIIQENAPRILGYHNDIEKDSKYIREKFKGQSAFLKNEIIDYSKRSKVIKPQDFQ